MSQETPGGQWPKISSKWNRISIVILRLIKAHRCDLLEDLPVHRAFTKQASSDISRHVMGGALEMHHVTFSRGIWPLVNSAQEKMILSPIYLSHKKIQNTEQFIQEAGSA